MVKNLRLLFLTLLCAVFNASMAYETVTVPYEEELINSQGQFEIENVSLGGLEAIWKTSKYGMTANGYKCTGDVESWFISPLIDASSVTSLFLTFDQNVTYFTSTEVALEEATLWVREGSNGNWTKLTIPNFENVSNNNFSNAGNIDLSAYAGKTIQLGFKYTATATKPGRWEIKNLKVTGEAAVVKEKPGLSYEPSGNFIAYLNEENTFPVLQNPNNLPVTYTSNNEAAATVDADGKVSLVAEGNATIKAYFEGNDTYEAGDASYYLVVKERAVAGTDVFELVTSASDLADGDAIIIVNEDKDYALGTTSNENANNRPGEGVTDEGDKITPDSKVQVITLEGSAGAWYFNVGDGYLYAASTSANQLKTEKGEEPSEKAKVTTLEIENGVATVLFNQWDAEGKARTKLRYNPNSGNPIFSCYGESATTGTPVRIYKKPSTPSTQEPAGLEYSAEEFEWTIGVSKASDLPTLSNPNKLTVTYESTNTNVATVDANGKVTVKEVVGETTIKAHSAETSEFKEGNASYTLKVVKQFVAKTYELVTSAKTLKAGDNIIIVSPTNDYAMSTDQQANYRGITEATLAENYTITSTAEMADIVLGGQEGAWTFQVTNGDAIGYLYAPGGGNNLRTAESATQAGATATIEINAEGNAEILFNVAEDITQNSMRFNKSANRFSCYNPEVNKSPLVRIYREARDYEEIEITSAGYATMYYGQKTLKVPSGVTAYTYKATTEGLAISKLYNAKAVIPAGLAVVIKGAEGVYKFEKATGGTADANNMLMGFDDLAETVGPDESGSYLFYALSQNGNDEVGFYFMAEEGAAFKSGPHKAYLAVPADVAAAFYQFDGSSDGINNINREINANDEVYTISGVRVSGQLQKGIYIVNGKKVVVK